MVHAKPLEETEKELTTTALMETEIMEKVTSTEGHGEVPTASKDEGPALSGGESGGFADEGASSDESS
jgi:hypothetical protein